MANTFPKLHNAMWPGLVGKGPDSEPPISLDTMLELTDKAEVDGVRFDGVDLFLADPHTSIDASDDDIARLADKLRAKRLEVGSVVAPVWPPVGGGRAMGDAEERARFVTMVRKACRIGKKLRELACARRAWCASIPQPAFTTGRRTRKATRSSSRRPFARPATWLRIPAKGSRRKARSAGAACIAGNGWCACSKPSGGRRPSASRPIWRIPCSTRSASTRPRTVSCPPISNGSSAVLQQALAELTHALRPWTIDFHVAQNDATVKGMGSHDKTGRHCQVTDADGKLDIVHDAGTWMRDDEGALTRAFRHICWDGCMFPNHVMMQQKTWNDILATMSKVRDAHGWN